MEDIKNEFHLATVNDFEWKLYRVYSYKFKHEKKDRQPGEPLHSTFKFENLSSDQPMNFILTAKDGDIKNIKMEIDNYKQLSIPVTLKAGETIKYTGGDRAKVYDKNWFELKEIKIDSSVLALSKGEHNLIFDCKFAGGESPSAKLEFRIIASAEAVKK